MTSPARHGLHERLRSATAESHRRLERELDWEARTATRLGYRALLARLHGFHAAYEPAIAEALGGDRLFQDRQRLVLLEADLGHLGLASVAIAALPQPPRIVLAGPAAALGALYVLEGSTLGGQLIARNIERRLGTDIAQACAYYRGHGRATAARWAAFLDALDARVAGTAMQDVACEAAVATFDALRAWLVEDASPPLSAGPAGPSHRAPPSLARREAPAARAPHPAPA